MYRDGQILVPIKHESKKTEEFYGRSYNVFCTLRSKERLELGYIGYDMSAAMQSISLQLIKATENDGMVPSAQSGYAKDIKQP